MLLARDVVKNLRATGLHRETSSSHQVHWCSGWKTSCSPKRTLLLQSAHAAVFSCSCRRRSSGRGDRDEQKKAMAPKQVMFTLLKPGSHGAILLAISQLRSGSCVRESMVEEASSQHCSCKIAPCESGDQWATTNSCGHECSGLFVCSELIIKIIRCSLRTTNAGAGSVDKRDMDWLRLLRSRSNEEH